MENSIEGIEIHPGGEKIGVTAWSPTIAAPVRVTWCADGVTIELESSERFPAPGRWSKLGSATLTDDVREMIVRGAYQSAEEVGWWGLSGARQKVREVSRLTL
jgi:hypothetical protein